MDQQKKKAPPVPKFKTIEVEKPKPIVNTLSQINDKLAQMVKNSKSVKLTTVVAKPQEYDPAKPNDYEELKKQLSQQPHEPMIIEESIGEGEEKAIKMMEKFGFKFGTGLGKHGQGIVAPLVAKMTSQNTAVIEVSQIDYTSILPQNVVLRRSFEQYKQKPTKILLLLNCVVAEQVDSHFEHEIKEEIGKYGQIKKLYIHKRPDLESDIQVRVFIIFNDVQTAMGAFMSVDQRVFGDRIISCRFYDEESFDQCKFDEIVE